MSDDRLIGMLGSLRNERMDRIADDKIRAQLENAWTARMERRSLLFRVRRWSPVLATLVLFAGMSAATMNATGDSPLYAVRVAIEDATIPLHIDPQDRADYVVSLLEQRQTEAARLEATGNAAAASKVRKIEQDTLRIVRALLPEAPDEDSAPTTAETPSPTPSASPSATPSPVPTPIAAQTGPADTFRPGAPSPTRTPTPPPATPTPVRTPAPTPAPTGSPMLVVFSGLVKNADLTPAANVCVRLSTASPTCVTTTAGDGRYVFASSARINQSQTIIFTRQDGTILWKGTVTVIVKGTSVNVPDVKLAK